MGYLNDTRKLPLRIRIRHGGKLYYGRRFLKAQAVYSHLKPGERRVLKNRRWVWGHWLHISALRLDDGELLIVISDARPHQAI
jgi:hypothetical protein